MAALFDPSGLQSNASPAWLSQLPKYTPPAVPQGGFFSALGSGLGSGVHGLVGDVGGLVQAAGTAVGWQGAADAGKRLADYEAPRSDQRPDLDFGSGDLPWYSPSKLGYNLAKAVPGIGGAIAAGAAVPEAAVPAWLARLGEAAPGIIGGGEGLGRTFGKSIIGAGAAFLPSEVASNVKTAEGGNNGAPMSREQAIAAIGLGMPEAAMAGMFPASIGKAGGGGLAAKILQGGAVGASVNAVQAGLSTGLSSFLGDPNKPIAERAQDVLQSALQSGLVGGVFGGAMGPFHGGEPVNKKAPDQVTAPDLEQSTAFLQSPEKMPLPPGGSGLSDIPTDAIMRMYQPLQDKGSSRSAAENLSHVALGQEVAMRTPPGMTVGTNLYSAEDMATRQPQIDALRASAFPDAPKDARQLTTFNATNEPELVNWLDAQVKAASPQWLKDKARSMGVEVPGDKNYMPPADILSALNDQLDKSRDARQAAAEAGNGKAARAANATVIDLQSKVANQERLVGLHDQADKLLQPPAPLTVDDALNLQGGEGEAPVRPEATSTEPAGAAPEQPNMLSSQETGASAAAQRTFQDQVAPGLPEGTIKAHDMPSLVTDLKSHLLANDETNGGDVDKLQPQIKKLMVDTGIINNDGTTRGPDSFKTERGELIDKYDALWQKASDKSTSPKDQAQAAKDAQALKKAGGPIDTIEKLQDLHATAENGEAPEVPGRVRASLAPVWKALESAKDLRADSPEANAKIKAVVDGAQQAIETNSRNAQQRGQQALDQISRLTRDAAQRDMSGPVGAPLPADIPANVEPKKTFDKLSKAAPKAVTEPKTPPTTVPKLKQDAIKKGRVLPDLTEKVAPVVPNSLEARIRSAYQEIGGGKPNSRVFLNDIRDRMPDVDRKDFDKAATDMHLKNGAFMSGTDNPPEMTPARNAGLLDYKGEKMAVMHINPPEEPAKPIETIKAPANAAEARTELQTLHDKLPEGSSQKEFVEKALAQQDPARWKSALRALQLTAANLFRDEGGSVNLGEIKRSFSKLRDAMKQKVVNDAAEPMMAKEAPKFAEMPENKPTTSPEAAEGRIQDMQGVAALAMHQASDVARTLGSRVKTAIHKAALITETMSGIVRIAGPRLATSGAYRDNHERMQAIASGKNKADILAAQGYLDTPKEGRAMVDEMLHRLNDGSNLDHRKPLDPALLKDKNGKLLPNAAVLQTRSREGQALMSRIQRAGLRPVLDGILQMNQTKGYQEVAAMLSRFGKAWSEKNQGAQLTGHGINPDELYQFLSKLHDSTLGTMKFYADHARAMRDGIKKHLDDLTQKQTEFLEKNPTKIKEANAMLGDVSDLRSALANANQRMMEIDKGTYSPLGHGKGEYFVAAKVKTDDQGNQLPGSMAAIQKAFEDAGFHNVGFHLDSDSNQIMTRLEKQTQMERARGVLNAMEAAGHLQPGETRSGHPDIPSGMAGVAPRFVQSMIESITAAVDRSGAKGDVAQQIKARMITQLMDTLPDSSIIPNLEKRSYASGYSKEMGETAINRAINSSRATTMMSMGDHTARALSDMRKEVESNQTRTDMSEADKLIGADAHKELMLREAQQAWQVPKSFIDTIRAATHTVGIGANIGYTVLPMSQIFTTVHGELAKKGGYVGAAKHLASSANEAFAMMRAVAYGKDRTALGFRESDMRAAKGVSDWGTKVIMDLENRGGLSSYTRSMADIAEVASSKFERAKGYANMLGSTAETYPRVLAALAAAKIHDASLAAGKQWAKDIPRGEYVKSVVDESMQRWGPGESSRLTGGKGPLGSVGKLAFAFTQFQTRMIEKLYTETHDLLSKDSTPEIRKEAGMFLASHLIATVALAGTLGLPASSMLAGVFDKLYTGLTGNDNMDVEGAYRSWLTNVFGPTAGDVLAKGLPRAFGVDMSKLGEQHLLPFSQVMQDKRKFEDVEDDWFKSMAGAAVGELSEAYLGLRDIHNGDYMLGLQKMLPGTLKDVAEAGYLAQHGFVNRAGQKEPIPTTDAAIVMKAMGFKTDAEAKYDEASKITSGLKAQRQYISQNISTHLGRAYMMGDQQGMSTWMEAATQFAHNHPTIPGPIQSLSRTIQKLQTGQGNANAFDLPLGMKPYDPIADRVGFLRQ